MEHEVMARMSWPTRIFDTLAAPALSALAAMVAVAMLAVSAPAMAQAPDPLPSWNDGPSRTAILDFVAAVTTQGSPDFVPEVRRIAAFDNDGTLWPEQPMTAQLAFALDRVKALAPLNPDWKTKQPFEAVLEGDMKTLARSGAHGIVQLVTASSAGMTTGQFSDIVTKWMADARHPRFHKPYVELVYQPMRELMTYLRSKGFRVYLVSAGGVDFVRPWSEAVFGVPPDQVIGSSIRTKFQLRHGRPELFRLPEVDFLDEGPGKPVGIYQRIGEPPIAAFGNSDDDLAMLQWTTMRGRRSLGVIVHHDDAAREYAYDREALFGRLGNLLDAAKENGWVVVSMRNDWKTIFRSSP